MADIKLDIPDIGVIVSKPELSQETVSIPDITVFVNSGTEYLSNINIPSTVPINEDNYVVAALAAEYATTASYALSSSNALTASYALNISDVSGFPFTGSAQILGSLSVFGGPISGTFAGNGSGITGVSASVLIGGAQGYVPLWKTNSTLSSSLIYQTGSSVLINSTTHHTPEAPDTFGVYAGETDSYNAVSVHGTINDYLQLNIKNFSSGGNASTDIVATADVGDESSGFINMGINNSGYNNTSFIGGPLDAYLYTTGSNLLIGNISEGYSVIIFAGGPNTNQTAKMFIDPAGTVGINSNEITTGHPESLFIRAIDDNTYNLITAKSNVDAYSQINIQNESTGSYASSDIVATANNGTEFGNFINFGINGSQYTGDYSGDYGNPNDAYLYATGSSGHLHVGEASTNGQVTIFAGSTNFETATKLRIKANNQHEITGSLEISGSLEVVEVITGSIIQAISASYVDGGYY